LCLAAAKKGVSPRALAPANQKRLNRQPVEEKYLLAWMEAMGEDTSITDGETDADVQPLQQAAQPKHRLLLFAVHTAFSMCQRMWEFSMVIFLADLVPDSLMFVALLGIAENVLVFAFSGPVGNWLDRNDRLAAVATLLAAKAVIFVLTMALLLWQFSMPPSGETKMCRCVPSMCACL
jgi:hypothetical protein